MSTTQTTSAPSTIAAWRESARYKFTVRVNKDLLFDAPYQLIPANDVRISPPDELKRRNAFRSNDEVDEWRISMGSEALHLVLEQIEADIQSRPSPIEFEMAYRARVTIDRIKFAINHAEQFVPGTKHHPRSRPAAARCARTLGIGGAAFPTTFTTWAKLHRLDWKRTG